MAVEESQTVSVIIPVYGRFKSLVHTVESILAQTHPVREIILIDDGSIDETPEALPRYLAGQPSWRERVRYFYQENQGQSAALNHGISKATGEWLAFDGSDDLWLPWKLEWQFRALAKFSQCALCFADAWFMNNPGEKKTLFQLGGNLGQGTLGMVQHPARLIVNHTVVWAQTILVRASLVCQVGGFDPVLRWSEDRDFLFRAALATDFCYVGMPMALIDRSPCEVKHYGEAENWHRAEYTTRLEQYRIEKQQRLADELPPDVRMAIRRNLRDVHCSWAKAHLEKGDVRSARQSLRTAMACAPDWKTAAKWSLAWLAPALAKRMVVARRRRVGPRPDLGDWQVSPKYV